MSSEKYIGGSFAKDDSINFKLKSPFRSVYFQSSKNILGFETGADALSWLLKNETAGKDIPVYFPLHYCGETINRILLKVPHISIKRYRTIDEIHNSAAIIVWNHFNGYKPVPDKLLNDKFIVIEDCVQSISALKKIKGKAGFTSLRKWLELDLALTVSPYQSEAINYSTSKYFQIKKDAEYLKREWKNGNGNEDLFLQKFSEAEHALNNSTISFHPLDELDRYDWQSLLKRREENAQFLIKNLIDKRIEFLQPSELFIMIRLEKRNEIRSYLAKHGIFAPVHWLDSADNELAQTLLSLPIDHRYDLEDMKRIINTLENGIRTAGI